MNDIEKAIKFYKAKSYEEGGIRDRYTRLAIEALEKQLNGGWIPVGERLPECEEEVLILTERNTITTAMYEDGKMPEEESAWNWNEVDFDYDEENDIYYVPEGWWEYRHFNPDDVYNNAVDEKVIAWQPLPEPYKEDKYDDRYSKNNES